MTKTLGGSLLRLGVVVPNVNGDENDRSASKCLEVLKQNGRLEWFAAGWIGQ